MASKETTTNSFKKSSVNDRSTGTSEHSHVNKNYKKNFTINTFKPELKINSGTASPLKNDNLTNKFKDSKVTVESFENIMEEEEFRVRLDKGNSQGNKKEFKFNKASRTTKNAEKEKLSTKMPNFVLNYDDLMSMITNNRNSMGESESNNNDNNGLKSKIFKKCSLTPVSTTRAALEAKGGIKKTHIPVHSSPLPIHKEETKTEEIHSLITSVKPKTSVAKSEKEEEERCIMVKSLTNTEEIRDFYENTEECLKRIAKLKVTPEKEIRSLMVHLPFEKEFKEQKKKLAVFDLDETLVHCEIKYPMKGEVQIQVRIPSGAITTVGLNIRPFWRESLQEIKKNYVIIVYTASHQSYADSVLDYLDPDKELIQMRLYRQNCVRVKMENDFIYVKDMRIFRNVPMKDVIIIDNSVLSFAFQLENGIPILPFYNNKDDNELTFLTHYLSRISKSDDLREDNKKNLKLDYFLQAAVDESSISESVEEDVSEEKAPNNNEGIFSLLNCNISGENSLENSLNMSSTSMENSFVKEIKMHNRLKMKNSKQSPEKLNESKRRSSIIQDQLLNTLKGFKKSIEDNINIKK